MRRDERMPMKSALNEMSGDLSDIAIELARIANALDALVAPVRWATKILARVGN